MAKAMERSLEIPFKPLREITPASFFLIAGLGSYPALPTADSFPKYMGIKDTRTIS
jgi:hypothetical protein